MIAAPVQSDRTAWSNSRLGRFTGSTMGDLMTEPRSKADKEAGKFGATARALITRKAVERIQGRSLHVHADFSMRRGTLLEHPMVRLLSEHWRPVDGCTWSPLGTNSGATPDALERDGSPMDTKCPQSEVDLYAYGDQVVDGEWESLLEFHKGYAWQIATQALATGADKASLIYCTDKLQWIPLTREDIDSFNALMEAVGNKLFDLTGQIYDYRWDTSNGMGFAYVSRSFPIPQYAFDRIEGVLDRAEVECLETMRRLRAVQIPKAA